MRLSELPDTGKVGAQALLSVTTVQGAYGAFYYSKVLFDRVALGLGPRSWLWALLENLAAESAVAAADGETVRTLRTAIDFLTADPEARRLLGLPAKRTSAVHVRRVFQLSEKLAADADTPQQARGRAMLRTLVFTHAHTLPFAEPIDPQRVRFKPAQVTPKSSPRPLISDLHDITDSYACLPIGALGATSAKQIATAVKERADYDLERIRSACIADMTAAAALRKRATELRCMSVPESQLSMIHEMMRDSRKACKRLSRHGITPDVILGGVLKIIHAEKLATSRGAISGYDVPFVQEVRALFLNGLAAFTSTRIFEIEYRACVEELFAAFHLLQTHVGWNWASVSSLQADEIDLSMPGVMVLQSTKSKTDDDTPVHSIDLSEPGVEMAIGIMLWNREQLVKCGFLDHSDQRLWSTRPRLGSTQRSGYFHPVLRLQDFIQRHSLPTYTLEQVRNQVLFSVSLTKGGIEAARMKGGHKGYGSTQRYVGNIVQDRLSSALNLEYSKRLEAEIRYLYRGAARNVPEIILLKPIGDGSSCINPTAPPLDRSKTPGSCSAESCHAEGGCPNRRIAVDDRRVEEVLRLSLHYTRNWQRLMQANSERFVVHTLPRIAFNAALLLALQRGPYAARVMHISLKIGMP